MSKKYKFIFTMIALAFVAVVVSFCCVFFGNVDVHDVKVESLQLQTIDGDYVLVAKHNGKFDYRFTIERFIDDDYYVIEQVKTSSNTLNLSQVDINFTTGSKFRFSACYTTENELDGTRSDYLLWDINGQTMAIDYETATKTNENLTWEAISTAANYNVIVVDSEGQKEIFEVDENNFNLGLLKVGAYRIYICSVIGGGEIDFSKLGEGIQIVLRRTNLISNAEFNGTDITFNATEMTDSAEIYVDDELVATVNVKNVVADNGISCTLENCGFVLAGVDFENQEVKILTNPTNLVYGSNILVL